MRESAVEKAVCYFARRNRCIVMKLAAPNQVGQPDRMLLKEGKALFIEFKAPGGRIAPLQLKWRKDLQMQGFTCEVIDSISQGIDLVERVLL